MKMVSLLFVIKPTGVQFKSNQRLDWSLFFSETIISNNEIKIFKKI